MSDARASADRARKENRGQTCMYCGAAREPIFGVRFVCGTWFGGTVIADESGQSDRCRADQMTRIAGELARALNKSKLHASSEHENWCAMVYGDCDCGVDSLAEYNAAKVTSGSPPPRE